MALITLRQLLDHAAEHGYGVPAFNINNMEQGLAIMTAAQATKSPVILQASRGARAYANDLVLAGLIQGQVESGRRTLEALFVQQFGQGSALQTLLSPDQNNEFIGALRGQVAQALTAQGDAIAAEFSLDAPGSALSRLVRELTSRHGDLERGARRQPGAERHVRRQHGVDAHGRAAERRELTDDAAHVPSPGGPHRRRVGRSVRGDLDLVAGVERAHAHGLRPASRDDAGAVDGEREDESLVVVRVLADQVHPPRRRRDDVRGTAESLLEQLARRRGVYGEGSGRLHGWIEAGNNAKSAPVSAAWLPAAPPG